MATVGVALCTGACVHEPVPCQCVCVGPNGVPSGGVAAAGAGSSPAVAPAAGQGEAVQFVETVYDGGPRGWDDWGWAPREVNGPGPAKVNFGNYGGWIVHKADLKIQQFGRLVLRAKPPDGDGDFLAVHVLSGTWAGPEVRIEAKHRTALAGAFAGWEDIQIPFADLDPGSVPFDRIMLRSAVPSKDGWTLLDKIGFAAGAPGPRASAEPPRRSSPTAPARPLTLAIACNARATRISPLIYGIAYNFQAEDQPHQWQMGATIRRWGGNPTTRYNWQIHAWNLDSDWFYENVDVPPYTRFLANDAAHSVLSALTVPIIGWVAKDTSSVSFPVSVYGPQARTDTWKPEAGNGNAPDGKAIAPGPPTRTSIAETTDWVKKWIQAIRAEDARTGHRSVAQYILDNEPALWNHTHRDVRPDPLSYDELVDRTIAYGTAIRQADPGAVIAGPAEWGWMNYIYSAKDGENGFAKADRKAHGDVPLIEYYLRKLHEHEERTGTRVLDVVDLHFYSEAQNTPDLSDAQRDALRLRSTRSLWDPSYVDESWINEKIRLLPRMKEWIAKNYPGRGISIGEWNFGAEERMSGGLATAEALGRFAQFGVTSAFYWTFPAAGSPSMGAFASYRNFDGKGGRFLDWSLPTTVPAGAPASLFASRDQEGKHVVAVALNLSPDTPLAAHIDVSTCGEVAARSAFALVEGAHALAAGAPAAGGGTVIEQVLPPYSITVLDLHVAGATGSLAN